MVTRTKLLAVIGRPVVPVLRISPLFHEGAQIFELINLSILLLLWNCYRGKDQYQGALIPSRYYAAQDCARGHCHKHEENRDWNLGKYRLITSDLESFARFALRVSVGPGPTPRDKSHALDARVSAFWGLKPRDCVERFSFHEFATDWAQTPFHACVSNGGEFVTVFCAL